MLVALKHTLYDLAIESVKRFNKYNCLSIASSLSFTTMLALVPLITVIFSTFSLFPVFETWSTKIENYVFQSFVPTAGEQIQEYLVDFSQKAGRLTAVGLLTLFVSSLMLLFTIENAFNQIWGIVKGRKLFQRLITYWAVLTLCPILIAVSLSMSSALLSSEFVNQQTIVQGITQVVLQYLPWILEVLAFVLFYKAIPNTDVNIWHALCGGIIATIMFESAKLGFAFFIINFNNYQLIYGALATIPIFLIWIFLSWLVMLIGAVIVAELGEMKARKKESVQIEYD